MSAVARRAVLALEETPGFAEAFAAAVASAAGKVCAVCGLERMGHGPESRWLGYERHDWDGVKTDAAGLARADMLTVEAYRRRDEGR